MGMMKVNVGGAKVANDLKKNADARYRVESDKGIDLGTYAASVDMFRSGKRAAGKHVFALEVGEACTITCDLDAPGCKGGVRREFTVTRVK